MTLNRTTRWTTTSGVVAEAALTALALVACGGGGEVENTPESAQATEDSSGAVSSLALTDEQRIRAATAMANGTTNACSRVRPFYWEVGNASVVKAAGSVGGAPVTASSVLQVASASKWLYGAYVTEKRAGALTPADVQFLTLRSGYTDFTDCKPVVTATVGLQAPFSYTHAQPSGDATTTPATYRGFLQRVLRGELQIGRLLGSNAVCTNPQTCADAAYSPLSPRLNWSYSIGHWVEDDPATGDGAFSSDGATGFYPWIDAGKQFYGIVAHGDAPPRAVTSAQCGALIRKAWATGRAR